MNLEPGCYAVLIRSKTMPHMVGKDFKVLMHWHKNIWAIERNGIFYKCGENRLTRIDGYQPDKENETPESKGLRGGVSDREIYARKIHATGAFADIRGF